MYLYISKQKRIIIIVMINLFARLFVYIIPIPLIIKIVQFVHGMKKYDVNKSKIKIVY